MNRTQIPAWLLKVLHCAPLWGATISIAVVTVLALSSSVLAQYTPPHDEPGPAVERLYFRAFNVDRKSVV